MKPLTWAQEYRLNWIAEMLHVYDYINREHIERKFRISTPQASADLALFQKLNPGKATYDPSLKQYRQEKP